MVGPVQRLKRNLLGSVSRSKRETSTEYRSFSHEGEDMVLRRIFQHKKHGFYVDVGAHHPTRFSNTYYFYLIGWHGINIDPRPGNMRRFDAQRPKDTNLEVAVSLSDDVLTYYMFNDPALNTTDRSMAEMRDGQGSNRMVEQRQIASHPLSAILDNHLPHEQPIDFLTVDTEGTDLDVLRSNDWQRHRPVVVLAEDLQASTVAQAVAGPISAYMTTIDYELVCKTHHTLLFRDKR